MRLKRILALIFILQVLFCQQFTFRLHDWCLKPEAAALPDGTVDAVFELLLFERAADY